MNKTFLHIRVVRAAASFGSDPDNILCRVLDIAGFAVQTVGGIDLQTCFSIGIRHEFINGCRAITGFGTGVFREIDGYRNIRIFQRQMSRLVFLMHRTGQVKG